MTWLRVGGALALLLALMGVARADDGESLTIVKGRRSVSFSLPDGGGGRLGVWKMISARSNLGMNLRIDHEMDKRTVGPDSMRREDGFWYWDIGLGPSLKRYLLLRPTVSPFLLGEFEASYRWTSGTYERGGDLTGGLGADWTPLEWISIGGATGFTWHESMRRYSGSGAPKESNSRFNTMTSRLTLHLYF
jgi:hypothetical protein